MGERERRWSDILLAPYTQSAQCYLYKRLFQYIEKGFGKQTQNSRVIVMTFLFTSFVAFHIYNRNLR